MMRSRGMGTSAIKKSVSFGFSGHALIYSKLLGTCREVGTIIKYRNPRTDPDLQHDNKPHLVLSNNYETVLKKRLIQGRKTWIPVRHYMVGMSSDMAPYIK